MHRFYRLLVVLIVTLNTLSAYGCCSEVRSFWHSSRDSGVYDSQVSEFLAKYEKPETQQQFEELVIITRGKCETILKEISIKGVVYGRRKKYKSLKEKVEDMMKNSKNDTNANLGEWISKGNIISEHPDMADLAGVRIGVYFPDDVLKVVKEIKKWFNEKHRFGTVTAERYATTRKNLDVDKHGQGRWYSVDSSGAIDFWKHSGYESWQMVVEWKEPVPEPLVLLRAQMPGGINSLRVEIQVGTVVSHAWAEVEHDIIYKIPPNIIATPTMKRMVDAIDGLAKTTEIILNELKRSLKEAENKAYMQEAFQEIEEPVNIKLFRWLWILVESICKFIVEKTKRIAYLKPYAEAVQNVQIWRQLHEFVFSTPDYTSVYYWMARDRHSTSRHTYSD